ncbi:MAG: helix-turn-helix transcriptional regulator [Clostridia bacterium]
MELNERLLALRKTNGMTQEAMAQALFVSRQTIYKWETGKAQPDLDKFAQICELFHVSADFLLSDSFHAASQGNEEDTAGEETKGEDAPTHTAVSPPSLNLAAENEETAFVSDRKPLTTLLCIGALLVMIAATLFFLPGAQDKEVKAAQQLGIVPAAVQVNASTLTERDFLQMLLVTSNLQHPQEIGLLADAAKHATKQRLSREKAAYWLYCTHVWTMIDTQADMSVGKNGSVDPLSQRNVYEELNVNSRTQIPTESPWDAVLCEETGEASRLFESYNGTAEMDAQILTIMEGAYYTAITFCAAQRSYESNQPIMELTDGRFRTKDFITATEAILAVYRLYSAW